MNHHPLHLDAHYAETSTEFGRNVVVGNLRLLGTARDVCPRRLRQGHRQPRDRVSAARRPGVPRRHAVRRDDRARQARVGVEGRPGDSRPSRRSATPRRARSSASSAARFSCRSAGTWGPWWRRPARPADPAAQSGPAPGRPAPASPDRRHPLPVLDLRVPAGERRGVTGNLSCPRCGRVVRPPGLWSDAWTCPVHGAVSPLHPPMVGSDEVLRQLGQRSLVPIWMPWPLPLGWLVSGVQHAGDDHTGPIATVLACSGPNPLTVDVDDLSADLLLVAEQPGVGLGAHRAGLQALDPGNRVAIGSPSLKLVAAGHDTPLWAVDVDERRRSSGRPPASGCGRSRGPALRRPCCWSSSSCATPPIPTTCSTCRTARCHHASADRLTGDLTTGRSFPIGAGRADDDVWLSCPRPHRQRPTAPAPRPVRASRAARRGPARPEPGRRRRPPGRAVGPHRPRAGPRHVERRRRAGRRPRRRRLGRPRLRRRLRRPRARPLPAAPGRAGHRAMAGARGGAVRQHARRRGRAPGPRARRGADPAWCSSTGAHWRCTARPGAASPRSPWP